MNQEPQQLLEALLHRDIPLSRAMQLRVDSWQDHELRLRLPLQPNCNLHSTMFGGSLYCGALLAGWGWLHLRLHEAGLHGALVIKDAQISYLLPVTGDALACCSAPADGAWEKFVATFARRGLARLQLNTRLLDPRGEVAVLFSGQFVLQGGGEAA
ncbi:thioesterase domain-containing protein [Pseudomonas sp. N040]|uniref:thioesterase domain-containing protein n=1 Tax=Pseudomonas sp. N040 TaxID=2785325 RepID=UPI0018A32FE7|nr:thioesterase domain-containing protein [Pseudomonas sp. N040]MBF7730059.1 thioesterase domain-containing protein [Pseudomonas sp. N040]MBW7013701.1 thioesterase domain-containing protein [Pseudomonas sp. N040]